MIEEAERRAIDAIAREMCSDAQLAADEVYQLAIDIMILTVDRSTDRVVIASALWRALAGFYARLAVRNGDGPDVAGALLVETAYTAASVAELLVIKELAAAPQAGFDHAA